MPKRPLKPFVQGNLDSLCGAYSVVNAVHYLCGPLCETRATSLFLDVLAQLEDSNVLLTRIDEGTRRREIRGLIQHLSQKYPLQWEKPFSTSTNLTTAKVWNAISSFLNQHKGIVLTGVRHKNAGHWTLINRIDEKSIWLFDSDHMKVIHRYRCTISKHSKQRPYVLLPTTLYFIRCKH